MDIILKRPINIISLIILGGLIGALVSYEPKIFSLFFVGIVFVCVILPIPIKLTLFVMAAIIFIDLSPITLAGSYIRLHQLLFMIYFIQFVFLVSKSKTISLNVPLKWSLFGWLVTFFLAYEHILSKSDFWVVIIGQAYLYLFYLVIYNHTIQIKPLVYEKMLKIFINSGVLLAIIGLLQYPLLLLGIISNHYDNLGVPRPSSLLREPDWYGLTCAYFAIFILNFIINKDTLIKHKKLKFFILVLGALLSLSRASWLSMAVGFLLLFIFAKRINKMMLIKFSSIIGFVSIFLLVGLMLFSPTLFNVIYNRINPKTSLLTDDGAADSRFASIEIMNDFIAQHPFIGNGVGGMNWISKNDFIVSQYIDGVINTGRGNANLFLTSMFDSGIVGTIFLASFIIGYTVIMYKAYKRTKNYIILSFFITFLVLITDFMFNNGIRFAFVWFHIAISLGFVNNIRKDDDYKNHYLKSGG